MSMEEEKARQLRAYENRESIRPGDVLQICCTRADERCACFVMPCRTLVTEQPEGAPIAAGETVTLLCRGTHLGQNALGPFVDYEFSYEREGMRGRRCVLNGPDAQALAALRRRPIPVRNRDILVLQDVLPAMQAICRTEKLRDLQRQRMARLTQNLSGMPGGGATGLDEAVAMLDELGREQCEQVKEWARTLSRAQRILNGVKSARMRSFLLLKYVMGLPDAAIRRELSMSRRAIESAKSSVENAPDMASAEWKDRYEARAKDEGSETP